MWDILLKTHYRVLGIRSAALTINYINNNYKHAFIGLAITVANFSLLRVNMNLEYRSFRGRHLTV